MATSSKYESKLAQVSGKAASLVARTSPIRRRCWCCTRMIAKGEAFWMDQNNRRPFRKVNRVCSDCGPKEQNQQQDQAPESDADSTEAKQDDTGGTKTKGKASPIASGESLQNAKEEGYSEQAESDDIDTLAKHAKKMADITDKGIVQHVHASTDTPQPLDPSLVDAISNATTYGAGNGKDNQKVTEVLAAARAADAKVKNSQIPEVFRSRWCPSVVVEGSNMIWTWDNPAHVFRTAEAREMAVVPINIARANALASDDGLAKAYDCLHNPPATDVVKLDEVRAKISERMLPTTSRWARIANTEGEEIDVDRWLAREENHWDDYQKTATTGKSVVRVAINISRQSGDAYYRAAAALAMCDAMSRAGRLIQIDMVDIGYNYLNRRGLTEVAICPVKLPHEIISVGEAHATFGSSAFFGSVVMAGTKRSNPVMDDYGFGGVSDIPSALRDRWDVIFDAGITNMLSAEEAVKQVCEFGTIKTKTEEVAS